MRPQCAGWFEKFNKAGGTLETHKACHSPSTSPHFIKHLPKYANTYYEAPRYNILMRPLGSGWWEYCDKLERTLETHTTCHSAPNIEHFIKHLLKYANKFYKAPRYKILTRPLCYGWFEYCDRPEGTLETRRAWHCYDTLLKIYLSMQISIIEAPHFQSWC